MSNELHGASFGAENALASALSHSQKQPVMEDSAIYVAPIIK